MKAIETTWNGHRFRSRTEARWGVFLNALGIAFDYEPETYDLGEDGLYLPDFWLPLVSLRSYPDGLFLEVKGRESEDAERKPSALGKLLGLPVVVVYGPPAEHQEMMDRGSVHEVAPHWDAPLSFYQCPHCLHVKIEFGDSNYMNCRCCGKEWDYLGLTEKIEQAVRLARSQRFGAH